MIVQTVIELAHGLRLGVVAEGVETPAAMALLARLGCDYAQGYLISRPIAADAVLAWVQAHGTALSDAAARAVGAGELIELRSAR
jgi:EAL domain-containing protein (putative c-di-GMP-specific phosphodiesterase class I)